MKPVQAAFTCLLAVLAACFLVPDPLSAREPSGTIQVVLENEEGDPAEGTVNIPFSLYQVGTVIQGENRLLPEWEKTDFDLSSLSSASEVQQAALKLLHTAETGKLSPLAAGKTGKDGILEFTGLDSGIYLLSAEQGRSSVLILPALVQIPSLNEETGQMTESVICRPKLTTLPEITIRKTEAETGKLIPSGFVFELRHLESRKILQERKGENGTVKFTVPFGKSVIAEAEPPDGYLKSSREISLALDFESLTVDGVRTEIMDAANLDIDYPNRKQPSESSSRTPGSQKPASTGRQTSLGAFILFSAAAFGLSAGLVILWKRNSEQVD